MLPLHSPNTGRKRAILATSLVLGAFIIVQSRSFENLAVVHTRDSASNTFREIQVLRDTNKNLTGEITSLETVLEKTKDSSLTLQALEDEIKKFRVITGSLPIHGPGLSITVPDGTEVASLIDLINELYNSGAEAMSLNDVRLVGTSFGLEMIPSGQILMNGSILRAPYLVKALGERVTLENSLRQSGGFLRRYEKAHPGKTLKFERKDRIEMEKVE